MTTHKSQGKDKARPASEAAASQPETSVAPAARAPRVLSGRLGQIYVEASRLFVERGYEATSMSDIAEAVKITKASLYHFVEGKEDLLFTIMSFGMDELEDEVVIPARQIEDPQERLRFIIEAHLRNIGRGGGPSGNPVTIVVDEPWGLSPPKRAIVTARKRAYFDLIRSTILALQARGSVDPGVDATVATHCLTGMILWMARWRRPEGRLSMDAIVEQITRIALAGLEGPSRA